MKQLVMRILIWRKRKNSKRERERERERNSISKGTKDKESELEIELKKEAVSGNAKKAENLAQDIKDELKEQPPKKEEELNTIKNVSDTINKPEENKDRLNNELGEEQKEGTNINKLTEQVQSENEAKIGATEDKKSTEEKTVSEKTVVIGKSELSVDKEPTIKEQDKVNIKQENNSVEIKENKATSQKEVAISLDNTKPTQRSLLSRVWSKVKNFFSSTWRSIKHKIWK